jgi:VWFA-related protein
MDNHDRQLVKAMKISRSAAVLILLASLTGGMVLWGEDSETTVEGSIRTSAVFEFGKGSFRETPVTIKLKIRVDDLDLDDQGWRKKGSVRVTGEVRGKGEELLDQVAKTFRIFRLPTDLQSEASRFETLELPLNLQPGNYRLRLLIRDSGGGGESEAAASTLITVLRVPITADVDVPLTPADRASLSVKILEPWRRMLSGTVPIEADVRVLQGDQVAEVRLLVDGELAARFTEPPYRIEHTFDEAGGNHVIQAIALSANGYRGTALFNTSLEPGAAAAPGPGAMTASTIKVQITSLRENDLVSGPTLLEVEVSGVPRDEVARVEYWVDEQQVASVDQQPFQATWYPEAAPGPHVVEARAFDLDGHRAVARLTVEAMVTDLVEEVQRVLLNGTIHDKLGKLVVDAELDEFEVLEDGVEQELLGLEVETRPIVLAMLLDDSGSMQNDLAQAQTAAKRFITRLRPEDKAMVVSFASEVTQLQSFTSDPYKLANAVDRTKAEGGTAMYDALLYALEHIGEPDDTVRRVIVLFGDGADSSSKATIEEVTEKAEAKEVMIYTIGFSGGGMNRARMNARGGMSSGPYASTLNAIHPGESVLRSLSDDSGGRAFQAESAGALTDSYDEIAAELRNQYVFVYRPTNSKRDGTWREVQVKSRNRGKYEVRTRKGYRAQGG